MGNRIIIFILFFSCGFLWAKEYKINVTIDEKYFYLVDSIKEDTKTLFDIDEKIKYNFLKCSFSCNKISKNGIYLLNESKKIDQSKNSYIVTFNKITDEMDKKRVSRAIALAIFEYLKEGKKTFSKYIKNNEKNIIVKKQFSNRVFDLKDIYEKIVLNNIEFKRNNNEQKLSFLEIDNASSLYKPQIELYSNVIQIDSDRAKGSNGQYSEGTVNIGAKLSQLIYSDKVIKNIKIKKLIDKANKNSIKSRNDEIIYKTIITYLNILKAQNYKDIIFIKQNFIRKNLEFVRQRYEIGVEDKTDIYRWENELANVNIELSNAIKDLNSLKIRLANITLIDKNFELKNYDFNTDEFKILNSYANKIFENKKIQNFFIKELISNHSSLKQLNKLMRAKKEEKNMNENSRYLPTVSISAQAEKIIDRYAEGKDAQRSWDDNEYQALINLSFPIYEGGKKSIEIEKNQIELINLKLEYENSKNNIIENIKQNSNSLKKSYENIFYTKDALKYSKKNYDAILNRYKVGKENIITLLDAQNSYFIAKINKTIWEITYLEDLSSIYFFSGNIEVLIDEKKKRELEDKLSKVINEN